MSVRKWISDKSHQDLGRVRFYYSFNSIPGGNLSEKAFSSVFLEAFFRLFNGKNAEIVCSSVLHYNQK